MEDDDDTMQLLLERLSRKISDAFIQAATTVRKAQELIERAYNDKHLFDAVVLDIQLPRDIGLRKEFDESICHSINILMPGCIVAHISAFLDEKVVQHHIKTMHDEQIHRSFRLSKGDDEGEEEIWFELLEAKLASFLYTVQIEGQLDRLFGRADEAIFVNRSRMAGYHSGERRSITHDLGTLSRNISSRWPFLDESLQARIKRIFEVNEQGGKVIVSFS